MSSTFPEALQRAEEKLTNSLGTNVMVVIHRRLTHGLLESIASIDHATFRTELQYTREEIEEAASKPDYTAITAETDHIIAVSCGYADAGRYFLDTLATTVERKMIGSTLATLTILYASERGYKGLTLYTEEADEKGRRLREWYERVLGFRYQGTKPGKGDVMTLDLTPEIVEGLYKRHIGTHP